MAAWRSNLSWELLCASSQQKRDQPRAEERVPFKIDLVLYGNSDEADSVQGFTALKEKINCADRCDELLQAEEEYGHYMR